MPDITIILCLCFRLLLPSTHSFFLGFSYQLYKSIDTAYDVSSVSLHRDHKRFVAGGSNDLWVRIYDFESGKELGQSL